MDSSIKDAVRSGTDLVELIRRGGVDLKREGAEWVGLCPFHNESSPSFKVNPAKGIFHCFGCAATGDCFDWVMQREGCDFKAALGRLALPLGLAGQLASARCEAKLYRPPAPAPQREAVARDKFRPVQPGGRAAEYLSSRGITAGVIESYRLCETHSQAVFYTEAEDWGAIAFQYLARPSGSAPWAFEVFKCLDIHRPEKDGKRRKIEWRHPKQRQSVLYGMHAVPAGSKRVVICEGEIDALTWAQYGFPAVSVPSGAGSLGWIQTCWEWIETFPEILISFDSDAAGQAKLLEIVDRLGKEKCGIVRLPVGPDGARYKDANACLTAGVTAEQMRKALEDPEIVKPERLKGVMEFEHAIWEKFHPSNTRTLGLQLPWGSRRGKGLPFRIRPGEVTVWSGFNGHGKSQLLNHVIVDAAAQGEKALIVSLEMAAEETYRRMIRMSLARRKVIDVSEREAFAERCLRWFASRVWVYDQVGMADLREVLEVCEYARRRYGVTQFVFDSLMRFLVSSDEDQWEEQKKFMDALVTFAAQHQCHIHLVAHSKKLKSEKEVPRKYDIAGSAAISNLAWNVIIIWRNRPKEDREAEIAGSAAPGDVWSGSESPVRKELEKLAEQPDARLIIDKQRGGDGDLPIRDLWFDRDSLQFLDRGAPAVNYVEMTDSAEEDVEL